jgi:hypothetical protein
MLGSDRMGSSTQVIVVRYTWAPAVTSGHVCH